eukprot:scaffold22260_cov63-Phaeocystis_antarctica.AAC.6
MHGRGQSVGAGLAELVGPFYVAQLAQALKAQPIALLVAQQIAQEPLSGVNLGLLHGLCRSLPLGGRLLSARAPLVREAGVITRRAKANARAKTLGARAMPQGKGPI